MLWINFLHFYQPANIEIDKIVAATEQSYKFLLSALEKHPQAKFTINLAGCLLDRWDQEFKYYELIKRFAVLAEKGQLELVSSAAYHAFLPLISEKETVNQIRENETLLKKHFGKRLQLKGFFMPEMAYSPKVAILVKKLGYEWLILDEIAYNGKLGNPDPMMNYIDKNSGLKIVFRNRRSSLGYVPEILLGQLGTGSEQIQITATDAELYGLHHHDSGNQLDRLLNAEKLQTMTVSAFLQKIKGNKTVQIKAIPSSWESTEQEIMKGIPYFLWYNKNNPIHLKMWELAKQAEKLYYKYRSDKNAYWSRWHLVRGLASCAFWWSSKKDFKHVFGPVAWNPDEVEKGANELIRSIRSLEQSTKIREKLLAESHYFDVKRMLWENHWREFHIKTRS